MKKFYAIVMAAAMALCPALVSAQQTTLPEKFEGFYRFTSPAFGDMLTAESRHHVATEAATVSNAAGIVDLKTKPMYSWGSYMQELDEKLAAGQIDSTTYSQLFQQSMTVNSWKSGSFPITQLRLQGVDYAEFVGKLSGYAEDAIEDYLNNGAAEFYQNHYMDLVFMAIFNYGVIYPSDYESLASFKRWCESYLTQWHNLADHALYLDAVMKTSAESETPYYDGDYYIKFKTPLWIGNMKKAQFWINNMITDNGANPTADTLDIWRMAQDYVLKAIERDYPKGTSAYALADKVINQLQVDMIYCIGEAEDGSLLIQPLPDTFGTNGVTITADDIQRVIWHLDPVDDTMPYAIDASRLKSDGNGQYVGTLYTDFAYEIKSAGCKAYYATSVDAITGEATLQEIADGKVPAQTAVVIRSASDQAQNNILMPTHEDIAPIEGNVLKGTLFTLDNYDHVFTLQASADKAEFCGLIPHIPANTAFYDGDVANSIAGLKTAQTAGRTYDLQGRQVNATTQKGIVIVDGRKVIK